MNKAELIGHLADKCGVTKKQAEDMVETFVTTVTETLVGGGEVNIAGFGAFMAKTRKGRTGVNPQNPTEKIQIPSVTVPKFKAGKGLKDALKASGSHAAPAAPAPPAPAPSPSM
jgi:DNA-binding protein HU-beta